MFLGPLTTARDKAISECAKNLRTLGQIVAIYASDYEDFVPLNCRAAPAPFVVPADAQTVHAFCIWHDNRPCGPGLLPPTGRLHATHRPAHHRFSARTRTPPATSKMPHHSRSDGRSPRNANAKITTRTRLSLSTGATFDASPTCRARK